MKLGVKLIDLFLIFFSLQSHSQHIQTRTFELNEIKRFQLYLDEIFAVKITTGDFSEIRLVSIAEGEYADELQLKIKEEDEVMYVYSLFEAILSSGFDKLSSNKVFAFQVELYLPSQLEVYLQSNIARLNLVGSLASLEAELKNGHCVLKDFIGNASINTYSGNIEINTQNADIDAETRMGILSLESSSYPINTLKLKSIEGNIEVKQSK